MDERFIRLSPAAFPGMSRFLIRSSTRLLLRTQVRWAIRRMGVAPFGIVTTGLEDITGRWSNGIVRVLHGIDDGVAGASLMGLSSRRLRRQERKIVSKSHVVTAISPVLAERWSAIRGDSVSIIPNGCNLNTRNRDPLPALRQLPRPVVCLVGHLNARIDMTILEAIVEAGYSLLMVGPHDARWEPDRFAALVARSGVQYVGRVPDKDIASYIACADIGITPYVDSSFNKASFPLKTLDYLSGGKPVVSTVLPATQWLLDDFRKTDPEFFSDRIIAIASDPKKFILALGRLAEEPPDSDLDEGADFHKEYAYAAQCRAFARRHSWSQRAESFAAAMGLEEKPAAASYSKL